MTNEEYQRERTRLIHILDDAKERGDYYLEIDVIELLTSLNDKYFNEDEK